MAFQSIFAADGGNINIQITIAVYIGQRNTGAPVGSAGHPGFVSNVFKFKIAFI